MTDLEYQEFYSKLFQETFDKALDHWENIFTGPLQVKGLTGIQKESLLSQVAKAREAFLEGFIELTGKIECHLDCGEYEDDTYHDNSPNNML